MNLLIINTLEKDHQIVQVIVNYLTEKTSAYQIFHTESMKINPCIGWNACWLKHPTAEKVEAIKEALKYFKMI